MIELMVAVTIGLIIAVASISAYLGASNASRVVEAQSRMNEDAQAALNILTQQLRMAGNNPNQPGRIDDASRRNPVYGATSYPTGAYTTSDFILRGCDGRFKPFTGSGPESLDNLVCDNQIQNPDSLAVSYEADHFNTIPTASGNFPSDCLGNKLSTITAALPALAISAPANSVPVPTPSPIGSTDVTYAVAVNRFYLSVSTAQVPSLYCKGSGLNDDGTVSTGKPLVENIEDLQFWYGKVATSTTTPNDVRTEKIAGYLSAVGVLTKPSSTSGLNDNEAQRWAKVITVRICVLARSEEPVASTSASAQYLKCDGTLETAPPDLRLRRAFYATVVLRNRRF